MVKIITQNVRGLREKKKRRSVLMHLRSKADIICLQETHAVKNDLPFWEHEWGGKTFWSHGSSEAKGVGILIKKNVDIEIVKASNDSEGRWVCLEYSEKGEKFCLLNVYAPNQDEPEFFVNAFRAMENHDGKRIIVGDFNTVLDKKLDATENRNKNNDKTSEIIYKYIEDSLCVDIWRARHLDQHVFTYQRLKPKYLGSRLDYIITEMSVAPWVKKVEIIPGFRSDHSAVTIEILPFQIQRGKGLWRINNQILYEIEFIEMLNEKIEEVKTLTISQNPNEIWESLKMQMIVTAQAYSIERAQNKKLIFSQLENAIAKYESKLNELTKQDKKIYDKTKLDLEKFMDERAEGAIFRSGAKYYNEGEVPTAYFFNLEKNRSAAKSMSCLMKQNGQCTYNTKEILKEQHKFYKKLYTTDETVKF